MHLSRIVIKNFRNFKTLDVKLQEGVTCVIGENNTGKTNLLHALRLAIDTNLSSSYRALLPHDIHAGQNFETPNQVLVSIEFVGYKDSINDTALFGSCEVKEDLVLPARSLWTKESSCFQRFITKVPLKGFC